MLRLLLISITLGTTALAVFGVIAVLGTAAAIQATGEIVGIGALADMTVVALFRAVRRRLR